MKKQLLLMLLMLLPMFANAHDIAVPNGDYTIYYNFIYDNGVPELEVTFRGDKYNSSPNCYSGNVVIPEEVSFGGNDYKVTSIGKLAFFSCPIASVTIPNSVKSIGESAFSLCTGLASITIPNSVTSIESYAFERCHSLTSFTIGNGVWNIGEYAFMNCSGLTSITFGNSVWQIGRYAFQGCKNLNKVIVPDIATWCNIYFASYDTNPLYLTGHLYSDENTEIKDLVIPEGVTMINWHAFNGCLGLTSVTIPNSVTSIGMCAFADCSGLTSVNIPNSVTKIELCAFLNCSALTSVTIPNSVTSIDRLAFEGANISTIISLIENPFEIYGKSSSDNRTFSQNTFNNSTLYVPMGTIDKYKTTLGWKDFGNIVEGDPAGINVVENTKKRNTTIYDLNGVRQPEPKKGVNIVNGKKVVVK